MYIGVDEAGRGPVLGSMFVGAVAVRNTTCLPGGIKDSKQLTPTRRAKLAKTIEQDARISNAIVEVPTDTIDAVPGELNQLTAQTMGRAISNVIASEQLVERVVVDACDPDVDRFAESVAHSIPDPIDIEARHGADEAYPIVSAGSIIAKVARDAHIGSLTQSYGDIGSGYPSDPTTRAFLSTYIETHGDLPACARRSWQTSRDLLAAAEQGTLENF